MEDLPPTEKRITVRDIADAAGVSHSTVSRALRGSPLVAKERREEIVKLAEKMGYRPDPMLSALTAYRSRVRVSKQRNALAFVKGPYYPLAWVRIIESAKERAERLGFDLQEYLWRDDMSAARQSEILRSRGVRGIIVGPLTEESRRIALPLRINYFSFVAIGRFISEPLINTVTPNHFASVGQAIDHLGQLGYRRIGLALHERLNQHVDDRLRTAMVGRQAEMPRHQRVKPLIYANTPNEAGTIIDWFKAEKPDVILSYSHLHRMLVEAGLKIPEEVGFASLNLNSRFEGQLAGTNINDRMVGQAAVDQLNSQLLVGEIGSPQVRQTVVVDTYWEDGPSAPPRG